MWNFLKDLCRDMQLNLSPTFCILDFEKAAHTAVSTVFPSVQVACCDFHLGQSFYRKIQRLGLQGDYSQHSNVGQFLKTFFGLSYVPQSLVETAFLDIIAQVPADNRLGDFAEYLALTYIRPQK